jgi:putative endonuclease
MLTPAIYILTNSSNSTLYIGVTSNLPVRVAQHKEKLVHSFSQKYNLSKLVYYEQFTTMYDAISREKQLKNWRRKWKNKLIEKLNPHWNDLSADLW